MPKQLSPQQVAEKQMRRMKAATQDMVTGVQNVTTAPSVQAIAKKNKLVQNWNASIQNGKWEQGLKRVDLPAWQKAMIEKGVGRVAAGVDASKDKLEAFYADLLPFQADLQKQISTMPDLTIEDSIQRSSAWIRKMSTFRKSNRG